MNSKLMRLTWNNHNNMVKQNFEMFLKSSVLVDCTLSAEGQHLKAHKLMLAACSHYFETLFRQDNMNNPVIVLKDVKFCNLKALIHFMYNGEVLVSQGDLADFIDTAKSLQVRGLDDKYKKFDLRKVLKKPKLDVINTIHDPVTPIVQMQTNYSDLIDIDETGITIGISRLSVNPDNLSPYHIQNTKISIHSLPTLASFELNNVKVSQGDAPEIKPEIQNHSQIPKTVNKYMDPPKNSDQLEKTTMLNNCTEVIKEISEDRKHQPKFLSSEHETSKKKHCHKSVQTQKPRKRNTSHKKVTSERKLANSPLLVKANNNNNNNKSASSSVPPSQTQSPCERPCCFRATRKSENVKIPRKKYKSRHERHFCEICKGTFPLTPSHKNLCCSTQARKKCYFAVQECGTFKKPMKKSHQDSHRGAQPFMCQFCHAVFKNITQLQSHVREHRRLKRGNSLPFTCQYCERSFVSNKHLQYHVNEHKRKRVLFQEWAKRQPFHSHQPVFECPICRKAFAKRVYLYEHQILHDRE